MATQNLTDDAFQEKAREIFPVTESNEAQDAKVRALREVIAQSIERIDTLLDGRDPSIEPEQALATRDWLLRQQQTATAENIDRVADSVRSALSVEDGAFFARIDAVQRRMQAAFGIFAREGIVLPVQDAIDFTESSKRIQDAACRAQGASCADLSAFLSVLERVRDTMEVTARLNAKAFVLEEIESLR